MSLKTVSFPVLTKLNNYVFYNCTELINVDLPMATEIGGNTFQRCKSLIDINFPIVKTIGSNAFDNCTSLTTATFPSVTYIKNDAFKNCSSLKDLHIGTMCTLSNVGAIPNTIENIYVPADLVEDFQAATNWIEFADKIKAEETE